MRKKKKLSFLKFYGCFVSNDKTKGNDSFFQYILLNMYVKEFLAEPFSNHNTMMIHPFNLNNTVPSVPFLTTDILTQFPVSPLSIPKLKSNFKKIQALFKHNFVKTANTSPYYI